MKCYVTSRDYNLLMEEYHLSGLGSVSAFLRYKILHKGKIIAHPQAVLEQMDALGSEIGKAGNNINQIAKKIHIHDLSGNIPTSTIQDYNAVMTAYTASIKELTKAYRSLIRLFS